MGIGSVAVYSDADAGALHVRGRRRGRRASAARRAAESYLRRRSHPRGRAPHGRRGDPPRLRLPRRERRVRRALRGGGHRVHRADARADRAFGLKHTARALATQGGLPLLPGTDLLTDLAQARRAAKRIGYPVMLKSTAGGGGIGMRRCADAAELGEAFDAVARLAREPLQAGGRLPREVRRPGPPRRGADLRRRARAACWRSGERDCSLQRRNQKVVEETPPPGLSAATLRGARRRRRAAGRGGALPLGRHRRVHRRLRATGASTSWRSTRASRSSTASPRR